MARLNHAGRAEWGDGRLTRILSRMENKGEITGVSAERTAEIGSSAGVIEPTALADPTDLIPPSPEVDRDVVMVPFSITYSSGAVPDPVSLHGEFEMAYSESQDEWFVRWDRSLFWPGVDGAWRFAMEREWPRRAPILARDGRRLARGRAEERRYPFGSLAGSTIGHIELLSAGIAKERGAGLREGDHVGGSGLEAAFHDRLAGTPAVELILLDEDGEEVTTLASTEAIRGEAVRTTIDIDVQRAAQRAHGGTTGGAVVLAPRSGDILAVVDSGAFDPNNYVGSAGIQPFNRALVGRYPPGSAMKVVTAAAGLETGVVTPSSTVTGPGEYKGVRNFESGQFGSIPFSEAVKFSVNTAFAQVAEKLRAGRLTRFAEAFGFNRPHAPEIGAAESQFPKPEGAGDLMWSSIGQAQVLATPLQMASVAATVANGGRRMEPRIDRDVSRKGQRVISRHHARELTEMMEGAVNGGTGTAARISGVRVAGKTGTAEVDVGGERRNHAWFICFAPAGDASAAVAIVAEYGGVGGQVAAPIGGRILQAVLPSV